MATTPALRDIGTTHLVHGVETPWTCQVRGQHECDGVIVGALGAYPTCAAGVPVELAAREAERVRIAELMARPDMQRAIAWEQRMEALHS